MKDGAVTFSYESTSKSYVTLGDPSTAKNRMIRVGVPREAQRSSFVQGFGEVLPGKSRLFISDGAKWKESSRLRWFCIRATRRLFTPRPSSPR